MQGVAGGGSGLFAGGKPPDLDGVGGCFSAGNGKPSDLKDSLLKAEGVSEVSDIVKGNAKVDQAWTDFRSPEKQAFLQKCIRGVRRLSDCSFDFSSVELTKNWRGKFQIENLTYTDDAGKTYRVNARINTEGQLKIDIPVTVVTPKYGTNQVGLFDFDYTEYKTTYKYREDKELSPGHKSTGFYDKLIKESLLGYGKHKYTDGSTYEGKIEGGEPNGHGVLQCADGSIYEGEFEDGKYHGDGVLIDKNDVQQKYVGKFKNGKLKDGRTFTANVQEGGCLDEQGNLQGTGQFEDTDGLKYKGEFIDGKPNGHGVLQYADGSTYVGEFEDGFSFTAHEGGYFDAQGNLQGKGQFYDENGSKYVGDFKDNQPHGQGTLTFPDGSSYEGEFKDGKLNGLVFLQYADGSIYEGEFQDDEYHGEGVLIDKNDVQQKYEGKFENGSFTDGRIFTANVQEGGCLDEQGNLQGNGQFEDTDGLTYEGEFKDSKYHGDGVLIVKNDVQRKYEGKFENGKFTDGRTFTAIGGCFDEQGNLQGNGQFEDTDGLTYKGEFKDGKPNGQGILQYADGSTYEGEFEDGFSFTAHEGGYLDAQGNLQGKGQFYDENGSKYVGDFKDNKSHGQGTLTFRDGSTYKGEFADDKMHGTGIYQWTDGSSYDGQFKDDMRHGFATVSYHNGQVYEGMYEKDVKHGQGTLTFPDGSKYECEFEDGFSFTAHEGGYFDEDRNLQGKGRFEDTDGSTYEGEFKDGKPNGYGVLQYADGSTYEGQFTDEMIFAANVQEGGCFDEQGKLQGKGLFDDKNGFKYVGDFKNNKSHGQGVLYYADGTIYSGGFNEGKPKGWGVLQYADGRAFEGDF